MHVADAQQCLKNGPLLFVW